MIVPSPILLVPILDAYPNSHRLIVGYSGGIDSHVLLHLLATNRAFWPERELEAIYIDHNLQTDNTAWEEHCARVCFELDIPFRALHVDARPRYGEGQEAAARCARYAAFATALDPKSALLTAHHCDDQAETVLLQLLRGAGPHGLAAMPESIRLGQGQLLRPLLGFSRTELLTYALSKKLHWIEDESNTDIRFSRNYLRHDIIPLIEKRWPAFNRSLSRSARLCAEAASLLDKKAAVDLAQMQFDTDYKDALCISKLCRLSEPSQRNLIRYWLRQLGLPIPSSQQLRYLIRNIISSRQDRQPCVRWPGGEVRRYRDMLYAMPPLLGHDVNQNFFWKPDIHHSFWPPLYLPGVGMLQMRATSNFGIRSESLMHSLLNVKFRKGGERFHPSFRYHSQGLKKLFQEAGIPPWQRGRLPLIYRGSELIAVVGLGIAYDHCTNIGEIGWQPILDTIGLVRPFGNSQRCNLEDCEM
jgi:tRNA(Ile)-lysidine synthase